MKKNKTLKVSIVMGSQSDYKTMQLAEKTLKKIGFYLKQKSYLHIELQKECMNLQSLLKKIILG